MRIDSNQFQAKAEKFQEACLDNCHNSSLLKRNALII